MMPEISVNNYPSYGGSFGGGQSIQNSGDVLPAAGISGKPPIEGAAAEKNTPSGKKPRFDKNECQTCKNRTYQDGSNDPGVSFKSPTKIAPQQSAAAVRSHEMEHVSRNQNKAKEEGREVLSQTVILHNAICPECGAMYVSGGETRTVTAQRNKPKNNYNVGLPMEEKSTGKKLNTAA